MTKSRDTADILEDVKVDGNVTAVGQETLKDNTGAHNTGVGYRAMYNSSLSGSFNVALGNYNLYSNTSGASNTALGYQSLFSNTTASYNTAVGHQAAYNNTTGADITAFGASALKENTTGSNNSAFGMLAMDDNTTGGSNTAVGASALRRNTTASSNTAVGYQAGFSNTTGANLVAVGESAAANSTTGNNNIAMGVASLLNNTTGASNLAIGTSALRSNTTASNNTAVGYQAGYNLTNAGGQTGRNTFVGMEAGYNSNGDINTFVGQGSGSLMTSGRSNTILGRYTGNQGGLDLRTASNYIVLSDGDGNPRLVITSGGDIRVPATYNQTTGSGANMVVDSGGNFQRSTSSLRYKNTVNDATHGLTELMTLRPVTYKGNNDGDTVYGGLIAEEVHDAGLTEFVTYNDDNEPDALAYSNMVSLCIKAIQELSAKNDALEARIATLEGA